MSSPSFSSVTVGNKVSRTVFISLYSVPMAFFHSLVRLDKGSEELYLSLLTTNSQPYSLKSSSPINSSSLP